MSSAAELCPPRLGEGQAAGRDNSLCFRLQGSPGRVAVNGDWLDSTVLGEEADPALEENSAGTRVKAALEEGSSQAPTQRLGVKPVPNLRLSGPPASSDHLL